MLLAAGPLCPMYDFPQGNPNNFHSRKECFGACHPQEEDFHLSGSGEGENNEEASEDDLNKLKLPIWLPFPIAPASSPDSVCDLVQVFSHSVSVVRPVRIRIIPGPGTMSSP